jgi:hypothetical protein
MPPGLPDDQHGGNDIAILRGLERNVPPTPAHQARAAGLAAQIAETAQVGFILAQHLNRADDPLRLLLLPLTRRPAPAARPLRSVDPRDKRQDCYRILSDDHLAGYQPSVRQPRRLCELIAELETLSQEIAASDPR